MKANVGLLATARKKSRHPAPVIEFYNSPLFRKSVQYARQHYDRLYFYNAKDGLLLPKTMMAPYDVSIKNFTVKEKRSWAHTVIRELQNHEDPQGCEIFLHGGYVYRKFLQPELESYNYHYTVPLQGLGIGQQLTWYDNHTYK